MQSPDGLYRLCGVVHHIGNTASSGHYTSCAKRRLANASESIFSAGGIRDQKLADEQWFFFDDRVGRKKSFDYVVDTEENQRNCYMALYELRSMIISTGLNKRISKVPKFQTALFDT